MRRLTAAAVAVVALASCSHQGNEEPTSIPGARLLHFTVGPGLVPQRLDEEALELPRPADGSRRPLLVLLHWNAHTSDYVRFYTAALRDC